MSKTTICKRARRKLKQAKETSERLEGFLGRSDNLKQVPNIKHAKKQLGVLIDETRGIWFEKVQAYLAKYAQPMVTIGRFSRTAMRKAPQANFEENLKAPKDGVIQYKGSVQFKDGLTKLPAGLSVDGNLSLEGVTTITKLPPRLSVRGVLDLMGCSVDDIPDDINATTVEFDNPDLREKLEEFEKKGYVGTIRFRGRLR